jgi:hypothetical protein
MKHWGELTDLETQIIRVGEFKNLFKLLVAGTENYVDIKVLQSAIYTMEGMIDDIDVALYERFQTVWDAVRDESEEPEEEFEQEKFEFNFSTMSDNNWDNTNYSKATISCHENQGSTVQINSTSEEDEAFKDLEKAIKNWHKTTP